MVISSVIKIIDSIINYSFFFIIKWFPWRKIVKENVILITTS